MVNFLLLLLLHCFFFRNIKISYHDERVSLPEWAPALWAVGDGGVLRVNRHDLGRNLTHCAPRNVRSDRGAGHLNQSIIWAAIIVKIQETINPSIFSLIRSHLVVVFFFFFFFFYLESLHSCFITKKQLTGFIMGVIGSSVDSQNE